MSASRRARAAGGAYLLACAQAIAGPIETYRTGPEFCPRDRADTAPVLCEAQIIERARSLLPHEFCANAFVAGCDADATPCPWYHYLWNDFAFETHFTYTSPAAFSCADSLLRGGPSCGYATGLSISMACAKASARRPSRLPNGPAEGTGEGWWWPFDFRFRIWCKGQIRTRDTYFKAKHSGIRLVGRLAGKLAGAAGLEPATYGFGDRRSTN